ncbi:MAG: GtrA family protein [Pseudomonadota bacterium]
MTHLIKYLGIGSISTLIQFLLLALLVKYKLTPEITISADRYFVLSIFSPVSFTIAAEVIASSLAYFLSSIFNYFANYHFTFASNSSHAKTFPKFAAAVSFGLATNTALFALFFLLVDNYLVSQFLATGITVFLNFLVHKLWIYKAH